uniref:MCM9 N-terminal domain-containing protein n=1 Tax=Cyprinodon variegatus TaxID=28743 RepID=A0A3Q2G0I3_CYPVA
MLINPEEEALIGRVFETYLTEHHQDELLQLLTDINEDSHRSVVVNAMTLFEANMEVGDYFNAYPEDVLAVFDEVLQKKALENICSLLFCFEMQPKKKGRRVTRFSDRCSGWRWAVFLAP